jgi:hypothetical protein
MTVIVKVWVSKLISHFRLNVLYGALDQIIEWRGQPEIIYCDKGPEYISELLKNWAEERGVYSTWKAAAECIY